MHKLVFRYIRALLAQNLIPSWTNEVQPGDSNKVNPKNAPTRVTRWSAVELDNMSSNDLAKVSGLV